ncbi:Fc.00g073920.m01.CDS01 [Cosmosporella sp. VM-42]
MSAAVANQPPEIKVITIDKDGDSLLVMGDAWTSAGPRFVVSLSLLSLALLRFKAIFEPHLQDSTKANLPIGARFEVSLEETYHLSLEILLSILH